MTAGIWFWIIFIVAIVIGGLGAFSQDARWNRGWPLVEAVLLGLLGWQVFGAPLR